MILALETLAGWLGGETRRRRRERPSGTLVKLPARQEPLPEPHCYEVLIPYYHAREALKRGLQADSRLTLLVRVWAMDVQGALCAAEERFHDHRRLRGRSARMAPEGPVPLRIAREVEERSKPA